MDYTYTAPSGRAFKIRARICDPITRRYAVKVDGVEVGRMFAIPEDAIDRGIEYARNLDARPTVILPYGARHVDAGDGRTACGVEIPEGSVRDDTPARVSCGFCLEGRRAPYA